MAVSTASRPSVPNTLTSTSSSASLPLSASTSSINPLNVAPGEAITSTPPASSRQSPSKRALPKVSPKAQMEPNDRHERTTHDERQIRQRLSRASFDELPPANPVAKATNGVNSRSHDREEDATSTLAYIKTSPVIQARKLSLASPVIQPSSSSSSPTSQGAPQFFAEQQTRQFAAIPFELNQALARLSSQHIMSDYNQLKRNVAAGTSSLVGAPVSTSASNSLHSTGLQRSFSSPSTISPVPLAASAYARPSSIAAPKSISTSPTHGSILRIPTPALPARPEITRATSAWPSAAMSGTPPRRTSAPDSTAVTASTMLTPTLGGLAFKSSPVSSTTPIAIPDPLELKLDSAIIEGAAQGPVPALPPSTVAHEGLLPGMRIINGVAVKTSISHPMNISALVPPEVIPSLATSIFGDIDQPARHRTPLTPSTSVLVNSDTSDGSRTPFVLDSPVDCDIWDPANLPARSFSPFPSNSALGLVASDNRLGNFMLSSCPGKKVRMDGAPVVGGRSAICRDVKIDLQRAKNEGVGVVVCCIDDTELAFLGAPWDEYSIACEELGLSVIRIPMVEGFAPASPLDLDTQLARIIREHTLRGESVLAHCRGGIGRAGLVACCWMLKMGLVTGFDTTFDEDPMRIVEKVIGVIRRRRSVKSIETPIQVGFLLDYVSYLQNEAIIAHAHDI